MKRATSVDRLTQEEARQMLAVLAARFQCPVPNLAWSDRARRGRASRNRWLISMGPQVWRGTTNCLLHEFAHILAFHRHGDDHGHHGPKFIQCLKDVTEFWPHPYCWGSEYATVAAAGPREPKP